MHSLQAKDLALTEFTVVQKDLVMHLEAKRLVTTAGHGHVDALSNKAGVFAIVIPSDCSGRSRVRHSSRSRSFADRPLRAEFHRLTGATNETNETVETDCGQ